MLDASSDATIRFAIIRRLDKEPGVRICDLLIEPDPIAGVIAVGVLAQLGEAIITKSRFDLPIPFELGHLHNEIDEIAEQYKKARKDFFTAKLNVSEERHLAGTGTRGRWAQYGLRHV